MLGVDDKELVTLLVWLLIFTVALVVVRYVSRYLTAPSQAFCTQCGAPMEDTELEYGSRRYDAKTGQARQRYRKARSCTVGNGYWHDVYAYGLPFIHQDDVKVDQ